MKKIIISLSVISAVAALAVVGTVAFFSDTETSTGNVLQAGNLDLKVDSQCSYNGEHKGFCSWSAKDLAAGDLFFNFTDVKPGDEGEDTISLKAIDNNAYVCAYVSNLTKDDNGCNEPEALVDPTCGDSNGKGDGDLQRAIHLKIWRDTGTENYPDGKCDNIFQPGEAVLVENTVIDSNNGVWSLGQIDGNKKVCLGVKWWIPSTVGNAIQGDSVTGDITFYAEQVRNNGSFQCPSTLPVEPTPAP